MRFNSKYKKELKDSWISKSEINFKKAEIEALSKKAATQEVLINDLVLNENGTVLDHLH